MKAPGPAPTEFQTCPCCERTLSRRKNFSASRHYATWYDPICIDCRKQKREEAKLNNERKRSPEPKISATRKAGNELASAMQTWR